VDASQISSRSQAHAWECIPHGSSHASGGKSLHAGIPRQEPKIVISGGQLLKSWTNGIVAVRFKSMEGYNCPVIAPGFLENVLCQTFTNNLAPGRAARGLILPFFVLFVSFSEQRERVVKNRESYPESLILMNS